MQLAGKKESIFCNVYLFEGILFNICVLPQCMVHWINFLNMYTFTYQKTLSHTLLSLAFKIVESGWCIIKQCFNLSHLTKVKAQTFWKSHRTSIKLRKSLHSFLDFLKDKNFVALILRMKSITKFIVIHFNLLQR